MDLGSLVSIVFGISIVIMSFFYEQIPNLLDIWVLMFVIIGTLGVIITAFPLSDLKNIGILFIKVIFNRKTKKDIEIINNFMNYADIVRKEGLLSLESYDTKFNDPFFNRGMELLMMGEKSEFISEVLNDDIYAMTCRHKHNREIFVSIGKFISVMSILGAVVCIINSFIHINNINMMAYSMLKSFGTIIFGIYMGYGVFIPFANRLKRKSENEVVQKNIILQGILMLEDSVSPHVMYQKLISLLSPKQRKYISVRGQ